MTTSKRFVNKVALVTGAGQGIGRAVAERLASEGCVVGVFDRNAVTAHETALSISVTGDRALALVGDVRNTQSTAENVHILRDAYGRIDILVNNAGFDRPGAFLKLEPNDIPDVFAVHVTGSVNCCRECGEIMIGQGAGSIVNVSSIYGKVGAKGESAYSTAKAALVGLTKALAREWGPKGIRVNAVLPGLTITPTIEQFMSPKFKDAIIADTPLGRAADPAEIAAAIAFLASDEASFITGALLEVSGGWNM
jgi:NAD(P)-dependent dehydrogenase (short-subunit alcohol dehydrogenase family)